MPKISTDFNPIANTKLSKENLKMCERFKKIRIEHDLTQPEYAKHLNLSLSSVKAIETGHFAPTVQTLRMIRKKYRISYDYLIDGS